MPVSISRPFDDFFAGIAEATGVPAEEYSTRVVPEWIAALLELTTDIFTKGWLNKLINVLAGIIANGYAILGKGVDRRLRMELVTLGNHELTRVLDPKPQDIVELRESIEKLVEAIRKGDLLEALKSGIRSPAELQAALGLGDKAPAPSPAPQQKLTYTPVKKASAPATTATKKSVDVEVF